MQPSHLKEILTKSPRLLFVEDILRNLDAIIELARDDVRRVARSRAKYFAVFDSTFAIASHMIKETLQKLHLKAIRRILSCRKIKEFANWIVSRLLNYMQNITQKLF